MSRLKQYLAMATLVALPIIAACGEGVIPPPPTGSIMGQVSIEGMGIDGVTVSLSNGASTATAGGGNYRFDNVDQGSYTVTISGFPADASFDATSAPANIGESGGTVTVDFRGSYIRTASIMGTVTVEGTGLGGVTVRLSGMSDGVTTTDDVGQYSFTGLRSGTYTVDITGFNADEVGFSSTSGAATVGVGESKIVSFDGTYLRTAGIQGQVSVEGQGISNVTVTLVGQGEDETTVTDAGGLYAFSQLRSGSYQVAISDYDTSDYEFSTTSKSVTIASGETANVPFEGTLLRTSGIAGRVSVGGMGIADVTVTLSGAEDRETMTDASGQYAIAGLAAGDYTVTISGYDAVEYTFEDSQDVTLAMDETEIVNFDGTALRTASVAVSVTADGEGVAGASVTLTHITGATSGTLIGVQATDADGGATFGPLLAGAYRVDIAVDSDEIDFEATTATVNVATAEAGSATFAGTINRTASISGMVTVDGAGMGGIGVMLSGGEGDQEAETGDDGSYSFDGLRKGAYTVSIMNPDENRYEFARTSESVDLAVGQEQSVSFSGTMIRSSSISGRVGLTDGTSVEGVTVTLSGDADDEAMTDAGGLYSFTGLGAGDYTVTIALSDEHAAAYNFDDMSEDVTLGDDEQKTVHFTGSHDMSASVTVRLFVDEAPKNDMMDEGEDPFPTAEMLQMVAAAGLPLALPIELEGPGVGETHSGTAMPDGSVVFSNLRAGKYEVSISDISAEVLAGLAAVAPDLAAALRDYAYGGPAAGYSIDVGVGEPAMQYAPVDITHTTVNFSVSLKRGDETGPALAGAAVTLYADAAGDNKAGDGMTDENGMTSIRVERGGSHMVYAAVASDDYSVDPDAGMQAVMWDPKMTSTDASNAADIVNLAVDVTISGNTVDRGDYGGGEGLAGWAITTMMGDGEAEEAMLGDDGTLPFTATVEAGDLPVTYTFAVAEDQDNKLDGGEKYEGTDAEYMHDGLSLMGTMEADPIVVTYTTQMLKVFVHHELDQVPNYTGNVLGGDVRMSGMLDVEVRYIDDAGRSRAFDSEVGIKMADDKKGMLTFTGVPADKNVHVRADESADGIMLLDPNERFANTKSDGAEGGLFGANGGFSHTVELCPLRAVDPTGQDHGECGTFAFVSTHTVSGLVWKKQATANKGDPGFTIKDPVFVPGVTVSLNPVAGKNIAGDDESQTTTEKDLKPTKRDDTHQFDFGAIAAGVYELKVEPAGWRTRLGGKGATAMVGNALNPLAGDIAIDVTPATGSVYGRVTGDDGFPVKGVTVTANGGSDETDDYGRYIIEGLSPETRTINKVKHENSIFISTGHAGSEETLGIIAFEANEPKLHNISTSLLADISTISGSVTMSGTGDPVAGVEIQVDGAAPTNPNAKSTGASENDIFKTGDDGTYTIEVGAKPAGTNVTVTATKEGLTITPVGGIDVPALKDQHFQGVTFTAHENATIRGRVVHPDGGPFEGVKVTATSTAAGTTAPTDESTTNSVGFFTLSVSWGTYTIEATKAGYDFALPEGRTTWDVSVGPGDDLSFGDITSTVDATRTTLSALSLSAGTLAPDFASDVTDYTAEVGNDVEEVTVTATPTDAGATVAITPADADNDDTNGHQVALAVGETMIAATVTAADGTTIGAAYNVAVTRANPAPTVTLVLTPDEINEFWDHDDDAGTGNVPGVSTVTATVSPTVDREFTVTVSIDDGPGNWATLSDDVELTFAADAGASTGTVTITAINDASYTGDREVTVSGASSDAGVADPADVTLTIEEDETGTVPGVVQNLAAAAEDRQVKLTWERPTQAGSDPITGYKWTASATGRLPLNGEVGATAREHTVTGLDNGIEYSFSVVAVNASGDGTAPTAVTATPVPTIILTLDGTALVEGATGTETGASITATVSLSNPTAVEVSVAVAEVVDGTAQLAVADGAAVVIAAGQTAPAEGTADIVITAVDDDLDDDGDAEVQATSANANSSDSDATEDDAQAHTISITDEDEAPSALDFLDVTASATAGQIDLAWGFRVSGDASWGTGTTTQQFQYCHKDDGTACTTDAEWAGTGATVGIAVATARQASITGLTAGTEYTISVRANTEAGSGPASTGAATPS